VCDRARIDSESPRWFSCANGLAAIYRSANHYIDGNCIIVKSDRNFVVVRCGGLSVASAYIAPNESNDEFLETLDELGNIIYSTSGNVILTGDFNAKSPLWGCRAPDWRGNVLERWAAALDLRLANDGHSPTCVRTQGSSIIDLTWSSADIARYVSDWQVLFEVISLSDHRYVRFNFRDVARTQSFSKLKRYPRWNLKELDKDLYVESLMWLCRNRPDSDSVDFLSAHLNNAMTSACDLAAKSLRGQRRGMYWWCDDVAQARRRCIAARRLWTKHRGISGAIKKANAWDELLKTIDDDPWRMPYRIVMNRLRRSGPTLTESIEPVVVENILETLFPTGETHDPEEIWRNRDCPVHECHVSVAEVTEAIRARKRGGCPAPDGLSIILWKCAPVCVVERLAELYTLCLERGVFPRIWKRAILVLIPKGTFDVRQSKVRPICLLNDVGKFLERIIVKRMKSFMETCPRPRVLFSEVQFGFREGRSTMDALKTVFDPQKD